MDLKKLIEQLKAVMAELDAAVATMDDPKADDGAKSAAQKTYEAKSAEYAALEKKIDEAKRHAQRGKSLNELQQLAAVVPPGVLPVTPVVPAEAKNNEANDAELVKQFGNYIQGKTISDSARDALAPRNQKWDQAKSGVRVPDVLLPHVMPAAPQGKALPMKSTTATGNQTVFPENRGELIMYPGEAPALYPKVERVPTQAGTVKWPRLKQGAGSNQYGGVTVTWTGEGADKTGTEALFEQMSVSAYELSAYTELSQTLINRSSLDLPGLLGKLFRPALLDAVDTAILQGDGTAKPKGILAMTGISLPNRATANQVNYDDLVDLEAAVPAQLRANCVWVIAGSALTHLKKKKDSQQRPLFVPATAQGMPATLLGYPVISTERLPALGTKGDVLFGDPRQYIVAEEQEVVIKSSEHYKFASGVVAFSVFMLVGGELAVEKAWAALDVPA